MKLATTTAAFRSHSDRLLAATEGVRLAKGSEMLLGRGAPSCFQWGVPVPHDFFFRFHNCSIIKRRQR